MTDAEILHKAIDKAIANGFDSKDTKYTVKNAYEIKSEYKQGSTLYEGHYTYHQIVFTPQFAKALFGEDPYDTGLLISDDTPEDDRYGKDYDGREYLVLPAWQFHLQQMVVEEDPIKYLEQFLEEGGL